MSSILPTDSLNRFKRKTAEYVEQLKATGDPLVLTVDGKAELVVQDVGAYRKMQELLDRAEAVEGIRRGLESMERGEGRPAAQVFEGIRRRHESRGG